MATRAQKTKVGLFLVICGLMAAAAILTISGYKHVPRELYWIEFDESILGLSKGSIVEYMGVQVGLVDNIFVTDKNKAHAEMLIESGKVTLHEGVTGQLVMYSIATGQMAISLRGGDGPALASGSKIKTSPSLVSSFSSGMETLMDDASNVVKTIRSGLKNMKEGQLTEIVNNTDGLICRGQEFIDTADETLVDMKDEAQSGLDQFRELAEKAQVLIKDTNEAVNTAKEKIALLEVSKTEANLNKVLEDMSALAQRLQESAKVLDTTSRSALHEADNIEYNMRQTLHTLNESLESVRTLMEYLKQDPSALVRGKGKPKGGK